MSEEIKLIIEKLNELENSFEGLKACYKEKTHPYALKCEDLLNKVLELKNSVKNNIPTEKSLLIEKITALQNEFSNLRNAL